MYGTSATGTFVNRLSKHQQVNTPAVESLFSQVSEVTEETLLERLYWRAANQPERIAYQFLLDQPVSVAESAVAVWTYQELFRKVVQVAASLLAAFDGQPVAKRVLVVYHPGLDFVAAFLGCLAAGAVAIPVPPPRRHESFSRWQHVLTDADINGVLTSQSLREKVEKLVKSSTHMTERCMADSLAFCWLVTDVESRYEVDLDPKLLVQQQSRSSHGAQRGNAEESQALLALLSQQQKVRDVVAFLQYTSGSTSQPKGVKVTHANLASNLQQIQRAFGHSEQTRCVIWLPPHHDMGLIGGILQPLYGGYPVTLMSPASFLRRPVRWLEAISHFSATTSGGPNFAYDYCVNKVSSKVLASLDLTTWTVAFAGAEPVRTKTLSHFCEVFSECGFQSSAFYPCYGLAESTLFVSGGNHKRAPTKLLLDRQALLENRVRPVKNEVDEANQEGETTQLVSCGQAVNYQLKIVNPETRAVCDRADIGEIWLAGKSVTAGYWNRPKETQTTFSATLQDDTSTQFLRTGDLGFVHDGELFITGRLKEIIIIRGRNYYPQDIESHSVAAHPALAVVNAAFSVTGDDGEEKLIVAQEVTRAAVRSLRRQGLSVANIFAAVRAAISQSFSLPVAGIVLLKPGQIPRTTSGKIQRQRCRQLFVRSLSQSNNAQPDHSLARLPNESAHWDVLAQWTALSHGSFGMPEAELQAEQQVVDELIQWLRKAARERINSRQMDERRCLSPDVVLAFGNQGLLGMQVPKTYGGLGLGHQSMLKILQQLGAIDLTLALFVGLNNVLGIRPILNYGSDQIKEKWLPLLASGRELAAFALTEAVAGSHPVGMSAQAMPIETGWCLEGEKIWSGSAAWAGIINVFVQQVDADGNPLGITGFAVDSQSPGLRQGAEALTMGMRGMVQNTVILEEVPVDKQQQLGADGEGMSVAQDAMRYGRLAIAAACVGGMKRCAQLMVRYGQRRHISTGKLINNPVLLTRLSWLRHATITVESLVELISTRLDANLPVPEELYATCKIMAPELYWKATDYLMQALGGRGYIETNLAPQMMRDARVLRIFEGPTETISMHLGARISGQTSQLKAFINSLKNHAAAAVGKTLFEAASSIQAQSLEQVTEASNGMKARYQAHYDIGQVSAWAIALVALKGANAPQETCDWGQQQFEQQIAQALAADPYDNIAFGERAAVDWIQSCQDSIGEVDSQIAAAELDTLLHPLSSVFSESRQAEKRTDVADKVAKQIILERTAETNRSSSPAASEKSLTQWMVAWIADRLSVELAVIDPEQTFVDYGLDSVMAVELADDLGQHLGLAEPLEATLAWNFPTITALAKHLAHRVNRQQSPRRLKAETMKAEEGTAALASLTDDELASALSAELALARGHNL